jgi:hypothetical protein
MTPKELAFALRDVNGMGIGYIRTVAIHAAVMLEQQERQINQLEEENKHLLQDLLLLEKELNK